MSERQQQGAPVTYRGTVYPWQCDHVGHMNVMWYAGKFDEATWQLFASLGLTPDYLRRENRGMAALQQSITYKRELRAGDVISVRSRVMEMREKVIRFVHEMVDDVTHEIVATTELTGVHMDTVTRRSCPFPDTIVAQGRRAAADGQERHTS